MLQLDNTSPFAATLLGFPDREGIDTLFVIVKATFDLGDSAVQIAEQQRAVTTSDEYWGQAGTSSLKYASEAHTIKPGTDVVVIGDACAPDQTPVSHLDIGVSVADRQAHARVHGERHWTEGLGGIRPSRATPFVTMPVVYERAYGGRHVLDPALGSFIAHPKNPVGCGFVGKRSPKDLLGQPAPTIEDLRAPIGAPSNRGTPVGFGPIAPSWEPRVQRGGTYDEAWQRTRMPYLPTDFDPRFLNIAPEPFVFVEPLVGGEPIALAGFHPRGLVRFDLPKCTLDIGVTLAGTRYATPYRLETVVLEPTALRCSLTWRAAMRVDKQMLRVERVSVALTDLEGTSQQPRSA